MSEFSDLVTDVEKMIRQKTVLMAENENLKETVEAQRNESADLDRKISAIKSDIEIERALSIKKIEDSGKNQSRVINMELERLNEASKEHEDREKAVADAESRQRQKENELRGFEASLIDREKSIILVEAKQKTKEADLSAKNDDISIKLGRLESHLAQTKLMLQQDKDLKIELTRIQESNKNREIDLKNLEKHILEKQSKCDEIESKNFKMSEELDFIESELNKEIKVNNDFRIDLDKRKKDLDDKERSLDAEKSEMAMKLAKANIKNK